MVLPEPKTNSASSSRMKIFHRKTQNNRYVVLLKKYYKWVLWFSLSVYLFFASSPYPHRLDKTTLHLSSTTSRALIESPSTTSPSLNVNIYVYELPERFNRIWLDKDGRCNSHLFAAEVAVHEALLSSPVRTVRPEEADFFFVPVYVSCNFSTTNGFPSIQHARGLLGEAIELVSKQFPFWNRSAGRDHVFVASHDYGACFHAMEDVAVADGIPEFLKNTILLQTFGVSYPHPCQAAEHILIPPYVSPETSAVLPYPEKSKRDIWVFFRGKMEVHPKNISGRFYGKKVRTEIWERYSGKKRFYILRKRLETYREEIARSVYCLCPRGWAPWSPRLVESVLLGCVPVIIADGISLPFAREVSTETTPVPWNEITVRVPEKDIGSLEKVLEHVSKNNLAKIQKKLWDPRLREALIFNRPMKVADATWRVLKALEGKLDRSCRRRNGP